MSEKNNLLNSIQEEILTIVTPQNAAAINKLAKKYYNQLPQSDDELIEICEEYIASLNLSFFALATQWLRNRQSIITMAYFSTIERWLLTYIDSWGKCDQLCNRVINPIVEKYPETFSNVLQWSESNKTYVRRAAAVSLIHSSQSFIVTYDLEKVLIIAEKLKRDSEEHVQKGVGWLLKAASITYPDEIIDYLKKNVDNLPRLIFRYSLEKLPEKIRKEMMAI
jgi:3-methyladenine DNA glycosylase AlkD